MNDGYSLISFIDFFKINALKNLFELISLCT